MLIVRYADDFVVGFADRTDAERFWATLRERLGQFHLELHEDKTRLIEFGRHAAANRQRRGEGKPASFDFLGFTHVCGRTRGDAFTVHRFTMRSRMGRKLREVAQSLRGRLHHTVAGVGHWLRRVLTGHYRYYGVPGNSRLLGAFRYHVTVAWWRALRRRSQRHRIPWERMSRLAARWLPLPRIVHPYPSARLLARLNRGRSPVR